jgi:carbonic anhydrase
MSASINSETDQPADQPPDGKGGTTSSSGFSDRFGNYLPGRREALFLAGGTMAGVLLGGGGVFAAHRESPPPQRDDSVELTAKEARERLEAGNARYLAGTPQYPDQGLRRRQELTEGQHPFAVVLSCADSRVDPETLFDQGLGDLFVVRSAGQVIDDAVLGSLQYGVEHLGVRLVVVLGHSRCGAVTATIETLKSGKPTGTAIDSLVAGITPAVREAQKLGAEEDELLDVAIQINVEHLVTQLKGAPVVGAAASRRETKVIGAVYDLEGGEVEWI